MNGERASAIAIFSASERAKKRRATAKTSSIRGCAIP
jgi:hypothetical protein